MIPIGSCVSWRVPPKNNKFFEKVFGWMQNKVTGMPETHCSMVVGPYILPEWYFEYELSVTARFNVYGKNDVSTVYDILASDSIKAECLDKLRINTFGNVYGLWQTSIFIVRAIVEKLGFDGRRLWNPLSWLGICSEGMYIYLYDVCDKMGWEDIKLYMNNWKPDVFHAGDARIVLDYMVSKKKAKII